MADFSPRPSLPSGGPPATTPASPSPQRRGKRSLTKEGARRLAAIWQTHPRYDEYKETWKWLGYAYEGDGPYMDGGALVPHPRELIYQRDGDGRIVTSNGMPIIIGEGPKFKRRKALARYDNFAQAIVDTVADHQFAKLPTRVTKGPGKPTGLIAEYLKWVETDVDGQGNAMNDWLKQTARLAFTYGHVFNTLERPKSPAIADALSQEGEALLPRSRADQAPMVLRRYTPVDALDWLAPNGRLSSIKLVEGIDRQDILEPIGEQFAPQLDTRAGDTIQGEYADLPDVEFRVWDAARLRIFSKDGTQKGEDLPHSYGRPPVIPLYCRERLKVQNIGRSLLRDPYIYRDHYNMTSEFRDILRSQTFSMLAVTLGAEETVEAAKGRLGEHAGMDNVIFTMGGVTYVAPPSGPVADYITSIDKLESKMFKMAGLAWDGDSYGVEAAESRRLKAMDLNRTLAGHADEMEKLEYEICRLWLMAEGSRDPDTEIEAAGLRITHPQEFYTEQLLDKATEIREVTGLRMGPTFNAQVRKNAVPLALPNVTLDTRDKINKEIDEQAELEAEAAAAFDIQTIEGPPVPGEGEDAEEGAGAAASGPPTPAGAGGGAAE